MEEEHSNSSLFAEFGNSLENCLIPLDVDSSEVDHNLHITEGSLDGIFSPKVPGITARSLLKRLYRALAVSSTSPTQDFINETVRMVFALFI